MYKIFLKKKNRCGLFFSALHREIRFVAVRSELWCNIVLHDALMYSRFSDLFALKIFVNILSSMESKIRSEEKDLSHTFYFILLLFQAKLFTTGAPKNNRV